MAIASDMMRGGTSAGQALGLNGQANVTITAGTTQTQAGATELITSTIDNYRDTFADNVLNHNPMLTRVMRKGNADPAEGGFARGVWCKHSVCVVAARKHGVKPVRGTEK